MTRPRHGRITRAMRLLPWQTPEGMADHRTDRARQHRTRAEQLDRDGKFREANVERKIAERYERRAEKYAA